MPRFAANLSMMFTEVPFMERFAAAANAGFAGVEYLLPYEFSAKDIRAQLDEHCLTNVMFNLPAGDWAAGERGIACIPGREIEFRNGIDIALEYARQLGVRKLHAMAGIAPRGVDPATLHTTYVANIAYAVEKMADHDMTLLLEAINTRDMPRFFLNTQAQAHAVLTEIGAPNLMLQMDCYHMQIMEGDIATKLRKYHSRCGHVQIAGVPERHEPDEGEVNYAYLFDVLDQIGYMGWIGCEYRPKGGTISGLGWLKAAQTLNANKSHGEGA